MRKKKLNRQSKLSFHGKISEDEKIILYSFEKERIKIT